MERVISIFDSDGDGEIDFKGSDLRDILSRPEFIEGISLFSVKGDRESKLRCGCPSLSSHPS